MLKCKKPLWLELPNERSLEADEVFEAEFDDTEEWGEFYGEGVVCLFLFCVFIYI